MATLSSLRRTILVYKGLGAYEDDAGILHRTLLDNVERTRFNVDFVVPEQIINGVLKVSNVALLAIGGGYDRGLIQALGDSGMRNIRDYVAAGGSYLGICSGAYFACDSIEFNKGGPLEVVGERFLKFFPGKCIGPRYKTYDYNSRIGAVSATVSYPVNLLAHVAWDNTFKFHQDPDNISSTVACKYCTRMNVDGQGLLHISSLLNCQRKMAKFGHLEQHTLTNTSENDVECKEQFANVVTLTKQLPNSSKNDLSRSCYCGLQDNNLINRLNIGCLKDDKNMFIQLENKKIHFSVYFNGGGSFELNESDNTMSDVENDSRDQHVTILARYMDLPSYPVAMVKCRFGSGSAVLSGTHFEFNAEDIDGDDLVRDIVPDLKHSAVLRTAMVKSILQQLGISGTTS